MECANFNICWLLYMAIRAIRFFIVNVNWTLKNMLGVCMIIHPVIIKSGWPTFPKFAKMSVCSPSVPLTVALTFSLHYFKVHGYTYVFYHFHEEMNEWITCNFTSFSTVFQSYLDDGRLIMKGCVQWNSIYGWEDFASSKDRTRSTRSVGQRLTHWATMAPFTKKSHFGEFMLICFPGWDSPSKMVSILNGA